MARLLLVILGLALPLAAWAAPPAKKDFQGIYQRLVALEARLESLTKHRKTSDLRSDERTWQAQDAQLEALKKEVLTLSGALKKLGSELPPTSSPEALMYTALGGALDKFSAWMAAKSSWLFAGAGNPDLKQLEAYEAKAHQAWCEQRDLVRSALK